MVEKTIYLIRHAAPEEGTTIPYDVPPGPALSSVGQREALAVADFLAHRCVELVIHSPLDRTATTAHILADRLGAVVSVSEGLAEHRRGESVDDVRKRVLEVWQQVVAAPEGVVALVSHGSPLKLLIEWLTEGREKFAGYRFPGGNVIPTGGVWQVRGRPGERWEVLFVFQPNVLPTPAPAPAWAGGGTVL